MNRFFCCMVFLSSSFVALAQEPSKLRLKYETCITSEKLEYNVDDAIDGSFPGVDSNNIYCSSSINDVLRQAKNLAKDDGGQFYAEQIAAIESCTGIEAKRLPGSKSKNVQSLYLSFFDEQGNSSEKGEDLFATPKGGYVFKLERSQKNAYLSDTRESDAQNPARDISYAIKQTSIKSCLPRP